MHINKFIRSIIDIHEEWCIVNHADNSAAFKNKNVKVSCKQPSCYNLMKLIFPLMLRALNSS